MSPYFTVEELGPNTKFTPTDCSGPIVLSNGAQNVTLPMEEREFLVHSRLLLEIHVQNGIQIVVPKMGTIYLPDGEGMPESTAILRAVETALSEDEIAQDGNFWVSLDDEGAVCFRSLSQTIALPKEEGFFALGPKLIVRIAGPGKDGSVAVDSVQGLIYGNMDPLPRDEHWESLLCPAKTVIVDYSTGGPRFSEVCFPPGVFN